MKIGVFTRPSYILSRAVSRVTHSEIGSNLFRNNSNVHPIPSPLIITNQKFQFKCMRDSKISKS